MDTASAPPKAVTAPRSGSPAPQPQPERGEFSVTFRSDEEHEALRAAEAFLKARGFSIGTMQADAPRGILLGDAYIAKWRNLDAEDRADLHGWMTSRHIRWWRTGPIIIQIRPDAPEAVIEAFNLSDEEAIDRSARHEVEGHS